MRIPRLASAATVHRSKPTKWSKPIPLWWSTQTQNKSMTDCDPWRQTQPRSGQGRKEHHPSQMGRLQTGDPRQAKDWQLSLQACLNMRVFLCPPTKGATTSTIQTRCSVTQQVSKHSWNKGYIQLPPPSGLTMKFLWFSVDQFGVPFFLLPGFFSF